MGTQHEALGESDRLKRRHKRICMGCEQEGDWSGLRAVSESKREIRMV